MTSQDKKLAVLIDADNAQPAAAGLLLAEVAKYGTASVKRVYGDWTTSNLNGWKDHLLRNSIQPIQQFAYTTGKNATDSAMIIDAMDLLYTSRFDGFCIVSSDSDFTRLASRIRESGLLVYGFGERKTPKPFVAACDKFIHTENLAYDHASAISKADAVALQTQKLTFEPAVVSDNIINRLQAAVRTFAGEDGWASLAQVGHLVSTQIPDFDTRTYGYAKLSEFIIDKNIFEYERKPPGEGKPPLGYVGEHRKEEQRLTRTMEPWR
ncbi:NYN domain-containing protein [Sarocladium implicatum]|nr:NYN domain-containing protein [Sarocladium implicatum]